MKRIIAAFLLLVSSAGLAQQVEIIQSNGTKKAETISGAITLGLSGTVVLNSGISITSPAITGGTIDNSIIGGTTKAAGSFTSLNATGTISGNGSGITALNASNLASGTVPPGEMPAMTGDAISIAGTVALVVGKINGTSLSGLATGILKNTTSTGVPSIAAAGTDYVAPSGSGAALTGMLASQIGYTSTASGASTTNLNVLFGTGPIYLVGDFQGDPTGAADSSTAFQNAMNAACAMKRPLYLGFGTFKLNTTITMQNGSGGGAGTYGDGFQMYGAGMGQTVLNYPNDTAAINFQHACQFMCVHDLSVFNTHGSSTHTGINADGSVAESGSGPSDSFNNGFWYNIEIGGFRTDIALNYFSNSAVKNVSIDSGGTGLLVTGASNSLSLDTVAAGSCTSYGYHLSGGQAIKVSGADINASGTAIGILIDGGNEYFFDHVRCEDSGSGYPIEVNGSSIGVAINSCNFSTFGGGSNAYGIYVAAGVVAASNSGFVGTAGGVREDAGAVFTDDAIGTTAIDYFNSGSKVGTFQSGVFPSAMVNDGATAGPSNINKFRWINGGGSGDDVFQCFHQINGIGQYVIDNILQYATDGRAHGGHPFLDSTNTWGTVQTITAAGADWRATISGHTVGSYNDGTFLGFGTDDATSVHLYTGGGHTHDVVMNGSDGALNLNGNTLRDSAGALGSAGQPLVSTGSTAVYSSTFQASVFHIIPQATPGSATEGDIYVNSSDHHTYEWNGTAWKQLDN